MTKKRLIVSGIVVVLVLAGSIGGYAYSRGRQDAPTAKKQQHAVRTTPKPTVVTFDKTAFSITDPASQWVVVNKQHPLQPQTYTPADLVFPNIPLRVPGNESMQVRQAITPALESMFADAKAAGAPMMLSSGYRSYNYQVSLYGSYVKAHGQAEADTFSARPGFSEHQTGLVVDVEPLDGSCDVSECFGDTPSGKWVAAHAYEYGFIMRYPSDKVAITGYKYEPWHFRYVGKDLAAELHKQGVETLEEFFSVTGGEVYGQ